jgi:biopolymer transport protein TolR
MQAGKRSGRGRSRRAMNDINVVPYIDVMLVLLVIFMVTAPIVNPGVLDLPSVANSRQSQQDMPIEINIKLDGRISIRDRKTNVELNAEKNNIVNVVQRLNGKETPRPVVIAADKSVKYENVMSVMDELQRNAIARVGLLVKPAP